MAIICNEATKFFALETMNSTYAMQVGNSGELLHVCYGGKIDCTDDLSALTQRPDRAFSPSPAGQGRSNSLNVLPAELAGFGSGDFRMTACRVKKANGSSVTAPVYKSFRVYDGKPALPGLPASFAAEFRSNPVTTSPLLQILIPTVLPPGIRYSCFANTGCEQHKTSISAATQRTIVFFISFTLPASCLIWLICANSNGESHNKFRYFFL